MRVPFIGCLGGSLLLSAAVSYSSADTQHDRRISALEAQLAALQSTVENLKRSLESLQSILVKSDESKPHDKPKRLEHQGFPKHYKIRQKPYERVIFDLSVSFDVYSGDVYLGEFRQSGPLTRLLWDDINMYDSRGRFLGQLFFSFWRHWWYVPNLFFGVRQCYLRDARGNILLNGEEERFLKMAVRADSPGIEFQTDDHHTYKMKKVNRIAGNRRWDIVNDGNLKKVADIHESPIEDVFGRKLSGWTVEALEDDLDSRIPGYLAAWELAEEMDSLPIYFYYIFGFVTCLGIPYYFMFRR